MTKLEQLIQELCPHGVEYRSLGEICKLITGATPSKFKKEYWEDGTIPWMSSGEVNKKIVYETEQRITQHGYDSTSTTMVPIHSIVIALAGQGKTRGKVAVTEIELCTNQSLCSIICGEKILYRFLYHYLDSKYTELREISNGDGTRGGLSLKILSPYKIPVPPLEVQREIVRILDHFTELTAELITNLATELTARKKQYEYYKNYLLTFDSTIQCVRLGDICSIITKGTTPKSYTKTGISFVKTESFEGSRIVPEKLSYVDEETHTKLLKRSILEENDILVTIAGATIGKCVIVPKEILPANTNQALAIIRLAKGNSPKYVMYVLQSDLMKQYIHKNAKGSAQPNLNLRQLNDFMIPLPSLSVQERLVDVLHDFDTLCNNLSAGLPAEIQARQKQYEYYRNKLLTFAPQ